MKIIKYPSLILGLIFAVSASACNIQGGVSASDGAPASADSAEIKDSTGSADSADSATDSAEAPALVRSIIKDPKFERGFRLYTPSETNVGFHPGAFLSSAPDVTPIWTMAQWASKYDIIDAEIVSGFGEFTATIKDTDPPAKKVVLNTRTGTIAISVNTEAEYDHDRRDGESWPHLLLGQDWYGEELIRLVDMEYINMNMTYKVTALEDKSFGKADPGKHCAQFVWYLTLQNRNLDSPDYGSYVWFGLNLYDNRDDGKATYGFAAQDGGKEFNTGAFIYQPASAAYQINGKTPTLGEKRAVSFNILEEARKAYDLAVERHFLGNTKFEDLYIGSTNFGLEVTGTYNITVEIGGVSVNYEEKDELPAKQRYN